MYRVQQELLEARRNGSLIKQANDRRRKVQVRRGAGAGKQPQDAPVCVSGAIGKGNSGIPR